MKEMRPTQAELKFLTIAYNRFYDLFQEILSDSFDIKDSSLRLSKIKNAIEVYSELLNYEPLKWTIDHLKTARPPMEAEISS